jgi:hypothetical protein
MSDLSLPLTVFLTVLTVSLRLYRKDLMQARRGRQGRLTVLTVFFHIRPSREALTLYRGSSRAYKGSYLGKFRKNRKAAFLASNYATFSLTLYP